jgi:hypothetical protein
MAKSWPGITDKEAFCAAMCRGELAKRDDSRETVATLQLLKLDDEKRVATGWVSVVEDAAGNQIVDSEGHLIPITELEKAVHAAFSESGGKGKGGDLHEEQGLLDVVESFVVTAEKREALGFGQGPAGWVASFSVSDDDVWSKIKSGDRPELSLRGSGRGVPLKKQWTTLTKSDEPILITDIQLNKLEWFSTVDRGASGDNDHRPRIVLWKRAQLKKQETPMPMTLEEALATIKEEEVKAAIMEAIKAAAATPAAPAPAPAVPPAPVPLAQRDDVPEDVKLELQKRADEKKKQEEEMVALRKRTADLEDKNQRIEIAKRVRETMSHVPDSESVLVDIIKRVTDADADAGKKLEEQLTKLSKAMKESPLLQAMGTSVTDVGDESAEMELQKRAEELRKVKPELTMATARLNVCADQPELFERVKREQADARAAAQ